MGRRESASGEQSERGGGGEGGGEREREGREAREK